MPEMLLLVGDPARARNDNHVRIAAGFRRAGWGVTVADHDAIEISNNGLLLADRSLKEFDLLWPLGFGRFDTFFDRMQLLAGLETRFVNSPDVLVYLHGKHRWLDRMPETHTSASPERLHAAIARGGDWVLKPTAGSFGRDVHLLREAEVTQGAVEAICVSLGSGYVMAQRFLPEVRHGEKRTLIAGGRPVGSYLRIPADGLVSNLSAGGRSERTTLSGEELALVLPIARDLAALGAGFCAVDTVHPYLMEVNVANPGGLATLSELEGCDPTDRAIASILEWLNLPAGDA
jgi:glutathione synthase/RimK-type ligase-like ATP-grasp enzyme